MARATRHPLATRAASYLILGAFSAMTLLPFLWTVSTSLKPRGAVFEYPPRWVPSRTVQRAEVDGEDLPVRLLLRLPDGSLRVKVASGPRQGEVLVVAAEAFREADELDVRFDNYPDAWAAYPFVSFWRAYLNSLVVAALVTAGQVVTSALAAYAFARLRFPGRDALFFGYLATMMIPGAVTLVPTFVLLKNLPGILNGLLGTTWFERELWCGGRVIGIDSYFALIIPRIFSAYGTFLLRQFFLSIPRDLEDAARVDGCGSFGILRHVVLPLSKPALATLTIFTFLWAWGDFLWPLIVTNSDEIKTLPLLLQSFQGQHGYQWHYLTAASVTVLLPMLVVFVIGQRYFIEGIQLGAVKG